MISVGISYRMYSNAHLLGCKWNEPLAHIVIYWALGQKPRNYMSKAISHLYFYIPKAYSNINFAMFADILSV